MTEDFITFELAKKLKEKGYTLDTAFHYDDNGGIVVSLVEFDERCEYPCPEIHQVLKWMREKEVYCLPYFEQGIDMWLYAICKPAYGCEFPEFISESIYDSYEQAAIAGIEFCLNNLI